MNESKHRLLDILIKVIAVLGFVYGAYESVEQFKRNDERELLKPLALAQLETCRELVANVSEVALIEDLKQRAARSEGLEAILYGDVALLLNPEVIGHFRTFIYTIKKCEIKENINECNNVNMGSLKFAVVDACRNNLINTWSLDLSDLLQEVRPPDLDSGIGWNP